MNAISESTHKRINESDVNWEELSGIGINKEDLVKNGDLDKLLAGEKVEVISLHLTILGIEIIMDATIQIIDENNVPMLEICGIKQ